MKVSTVFPFNISINNDNKPFLLEFRQLKEYYNFQRRFKSDKKNINKHGKWIFNEYYLIDKCWLSKWKELVNYDKFYSKRLNRDLNDTDYNTFINYISSNKKEIILPPLDNSSIYWSNGEIYIFAEFIIVDKKCYEVFGESRQNMIYDIVEKSIPIKILQDKIIFDIENNIKIIGFPDYSAKKDNEIIIIFKDQINQNKILSDIEKENLKTWLKKRNIEIDLFEEIEIKEQGCQIKIINRVLKLKHEKMKNEIVPKLGGLDDSLIRMKFNLPNNLKEQMKSQVEVIVSQTMVDKEKQNDLNNPKKQSYQNINDNQSISNNNIIMPQNLNQKNQLQTINNFDNFMFINSQAMMSNIGNSPNLVNPDINFPTMLNVNLNSNNQNINNNIIIKKDSFQNPFTVGITYPHKIGLDDIGQSPYINAVIQCLSNIKIFSNKLLKRYGAFDFNKQSLCISYSALLYDLFHTKEKHINPKLFCEICEKLNPIFEKKNEKETDAKDFILFMIITLHQEFLPSLKTSIKEIDFNQQEIEGLDEKKMLINFLKKYNSKNSIVSDLFYGIDRYKVTCNNCRMSKFSFQTFNILIFSLKKVKEYKIKKTKRLKQNLNLYDAFNSEQEEHILDGEDMIYCNYCKKTNNGVHRIDIYGLPQILIIVLDRGKNNQDFIEDFTFDEIIDFNNKNIVINKDSFKKYYLCGIITLLGNSGNENKYISYCRNSVDESFLCYNDTSVTQRSVFDAMETKISGNDLKKKIPYVLFYHFMNYN